MTDDYQTCVDKLNSYYKLASDNSGKPQQFYTHLYKYIQVIDNNALLQRAANEFWLLQYVEDNQADEKKLHEVLAPIVKADGKGLNPMQQFKFMWRLFGQISSEKIKETKVYYCWYVLYFNFYAIHKGNIDPNVIAKVGEVDPKEIAAYLKETLGEDMPELPDKLLATLKPIDTKELADKFERITSSVIPHDSAITIDEYETCLGVFHSEFMDWLRHNVDRINAPDEAGLTSGELIFDENSISPKVKLATGEEYTFSYMKPRAYEVIKYCYDRPGIAVSTEKFPEMDFGGKGILNALRGSKFYPPDGALSVFLNTSGRPKRITLHRKRQLTDAQLQRLINESGDSANSQ